MWWVLEIKNLSKSQVLECCEMAVEYTQEKDRVCCFYELKSILMEDLLDAERRAKEKFNVELEWEISKTK